VVSNAPVIYACSFKFAKCEHTNPNTISQAPTCVPAFRCVASIASKAFNRGIQMQIIDIFVAAGTFMDPHRLPVDAASCKSGRASAENSNVLQKHSGLRTRTRTGCCKRWNGLPSASASGNLSSTRFWHVSELFLDLPSWCRLRMPNLSCRGVGAARRTVAAPTLLDHRYCLHRLAAVGRRDRTSFALSRGEPLDQHLKHACDHRQSGSQTLQIGNSTAWPLPSLLGMLGIPMTSPAPPSSSLPTTTASLPGPSSSSTAGKPGSEEPFGEVISG
jgi:hypothetical protein